MALDGSFFALCAELVLIDTTLDVLGLMIARCYWALIEDMYLDFLGYVALQWGLQALLWTLIRNMLIIPMLIMLINMLISRPLRRFIRSSPQVVPGFDKHVQSFVEALFDEDDTTALSLLEDGRVNIHSPWTRGPGDSCCEPGSSCCGQRSMLNAALISGQERVAHALLRRGADINAFRQYKTPGSSVSVAGYAISCGDIPTLALSHKLGANMDCVLMQAFDGPELTVTLRSLSAASLAIRMASPDCLEYLLDRVYLERPIVITESDRHCMCLLARLGPRAMRIFKVLRARGYDFSILNTDECERVPVKGGAGSCRVTFSDILVTSVRESGDASFMRYVVKRLGMASAAGKMAATQEFVEKHEAYTAYHDFVENHGTCERTTENARASGRNDCAPHDECDFRDEEFSKYECAACKAVCATMWCTGCRKVRYCSTACSRKHWKTGGHKKECKKL